MQKYAKSITAIVGAVLEILGPQAAHGTAAVVVSTVLAVLTALGVYVVPNRDDAPAPASAPAREAVASGRHATTGIYDPDTMVSSPQR